jgi:hypothetical protein
MKVRKIRAWRGYEIEIRPSSLADTTAIWMELRGTSDTINVAKVTLLSRAGARQLAKILEKFALTGEL